jgi:hypothetical protein
VRGPIRLSKDTSVLTINNKNNWTLVPKITSKCFKLENLNLKNYELSTLKKVKKCKQNNYCIYFSDSSIEQRRVDGSDFCAFQNFD